MTIELSREDYVICKGGKTIESYDTVYHFTSIIEIINDGFLLGKGEEIICMIDLGEEEKEKHIKAIIEVKYPQILEYNKYLKLNEGFEDTIMGYDQWSEGCSNCGSTESERDFEGICKNICS